VEEWLALAGMVGRRLSTTRLWATVAGWLRCKAVAFQEKQGWGILDFFLINEGGCMAIGWLSVLKMVPWGDVIENAPKVASGAKKLWNSVGKKPSATVAAPMPASGTLVDVPEPVAALQAQVTQLQVSVAELHQQMLESSALIGSLAEQNTQLIARVEVNRKRVLALTVAVVVLAVVVANKLF